MNTISQLFMFSLIAPWIIIGAFGRGNRNDNVVDGCLVQLLNWLVLFVWVWFAGHLSKGIFPVIVTLAIQVVFVAISISKARLPK